MCRAQSYLLEQQEIYCQQTVYVFADVRVYTSKCMSMYDDKPGKQPCWDDADNDIHNCVGRKQT